MQVETFGDGLIWGAIALIQVAAILFVIMTGDPIDEIDERKPHEATDLGSAPAT